MPYQKRHCANRVHQFRFQDHGGHYLLARMLMANFCIRTTSVRLDAGMVDQLDRSKIIIFFFLKNEIEIFDSVARRDLQRKFDH